MPVPKTPALWRLLLVIAVALLGLNLGVSWSQAGPPVDAAMRQQLLDGVASAMNSRYVFPEVAKKVEAALRDPTKTAVLQDISDGTLLADRLTQLLQEITADKHVRVRFSALPVPEPSGRGPSAAELEALRATERARNFGVERVERLPGNIGLIELRGFSQADAAGPAVTAAMTLVAHTEALIFDLRRNGGGDPATVALVTSYLFNERTHLNDMHFREGNRTVQFWTQGWVPGPRFGVAKPVYVLTSSRTFSGAEEFSYNLKHLKRATLIGETTGGGAHPGGMVKVGTNFRMFVPGGRAVNPITGTNWEGKGVAPDLVVKADDALRVAQLHALRSLLARTSDAPQRRLLEERLAELERAAP